MITSSNYRRWIATLLLLLVVSLVLHVVTLVSLTRVRLLAREQLHSLSLQVASLREDTLSFSLPIKQDFPIAASIPINQQLTIPISTTLNFDDRVSVPIETPLGSTQFDFPVRARVPIRTDVPITVDTSVDIDTTVSIDMVLPINLPIANSPIATYLEQLEQRLILLSEEL